MVGVKRGTPAADKIGRLELERIQRRHECPAYCHPCPHMLGAIMPMCMGTAAGYNSEADLTACTCVPSDPIIARVVLGEYALRGIAQLRDRRRFRQVQRHLVTQLGQLAASMTAARIAALAPKEADAWREVHRIADALEIQIHRIEHEAPAETPDELAEREARIRAELETPGAGVLLKFPRGV